MKEEGLPKSLTSCEKDEMDTPHSDSKSPCYCYGYTLLTALGSWFRSAFSQTLTLLYYVSFVGT